MSAIQFKKGDLVWARVTGFPPWPGKISEPDEREIKIPSSGIHYFVTFYASDTYAFVHPDKIYPYLEYKDKFEIKEKIPQGFSEAFQEIEKAFKKRQEAFAKNIPYEDSDVDSCPEESSVEKVEAKDAVTFAEEEPNSLSNKRRLPQRRASLQAIEAKKPKLDETPKNESKNTIKPSLTEPRKHSKNSHMTKIKDRKMEGSISYLNSMIYQKQQDRTASLFNKEPHNKIDLPPKKYIDYIFDSAIYVPDNTRTPPHLDIRIGFLGLGRIGSAVVSNLLNAGLDVMVWNRTSSKCKEYLEMGARKASSPSEVVQNCDIIFSCLSDAKAVKDIVTGSHGIVESIVPGKSFVDMSTVDIVVAMDLNKLIVSRGGRFLEAPIISMASTDDKNKDNRLIIVASGDRQLFDDCCPIFTTFVKKAFFLGGVGSATCMKLVTNIATATMLAGLAESLALVEKLGLDQNLFLSIISLISLASNMNEYKGQGMVNDNLSDRQQSLEHMQRDLRMAIVLAEPVDQAVFVTSATNELFKKAKARGYGDHDTAAICRATD